MALSRSPFQGGHVRCVQERLGLVIAQGRRLTFVGFNLGPFHPVHRVAADDRVAFQQVVKQAGQRCEFAPDGGPGETSVLQLSTLGQDVRARHYPKLVCSGQPYKGTEVFQVVLVGTTRAWVIDVGKPFHRGGYRGQVLELGRGQSTFTALLVNR
jgi:hypothetical protein